VDENPAPDKSARSRTGVAPVSNMKTIRRRVVHGSQAAPLSGVMAF